MRFLPATIICLSLLGPAAGTASADPVIYGKDVLSAGAGTSNATPRKQVVADDGVATQVYSQQTGSSAGGIFARRRPPGGTYGPPIPIGGDLAFQADAGIAADGTVTVAWDDNGTKAGIHTRTIRPDGSLGPDQLIATSGDPEAPRVAVNRAGAALVIWRSLSTSQIVATGRRAGASQFTPGAVVLSGASTGQASLDGVPVVGDDGAAYATWTEGASGAQSVFIRRFDLQSNATSTAAKKVSVAPAGATARSGAPAIDPAHHFVWTAWEEHAPAGTGKQFVIKARAVSADLGTFGPAHKVSDAPDVANRDAFDPEIAVSRKGDVAVGFDQGTAERSEALAKVSVLPSGGDFQAVPTTLTPADHVPSTRAIPAWDARGRLAVGFREQSGTDKVARAAIRIRRSDGSFGPTVKVAPDRADEHEFSSVATPAWDPRGNLHIVYAQRESPANRDAVVAAYGDDDGPPELEIAATPAEALLQAPIAFRATVSDFSPTSAPAWRFGDGSPGANGAEVAHAFGVPGDKTVTASATDASGQTGAATRRLGIRAPGGTPSGGGAVNHRPDSDIALRKRSVRRRALKRVRGTASDDGSVARVDVSIVRVVKTKAGVRCAALRRNGRLTRFAARDGVCRPRFALKAKGTAAWRLKLRKRLPRGRYVVASRATDDRGVRERSFSSRDRNKRRLRVTR